jgi:hypothetical protein
VSSYESDFEEFTESDDGRWCGCSWDDRFCSLMFCSSGVASDFVTFSYILCSHSAHAQDSRSICNFSHYRRHVAYFSDAIIDRFSVGVAAR